VVSTAMRLRAAVTISPQLEELAEAVRGLAFVAGGAARLACLGEFAPVCADIDLFLHEPSGYVACREKVKDLGYKSARLTETALSFDARTPRELDVQIICPYRDDKALTYGTPEEVLEHFSFTTEMFALEGRSVLCGGRAVEDTLARRLVVQNVNDPVIVGLRMCKYAAKGYQVDESAMLRLFSEWDAAPPAWKRAVTGG
jgi:hypothetical protein